MRGRLIGGSISSIGLSGPSLNGLAHDSTSCITSRSSSEGESRHGLLCDNDLGSALSDGSLALKSTLSGGLGGDGLGDNPVSNGASAISPRTRGRAASSTRRIATQNGLVGRDARGVGRRSVVLGTSIQAGRAATTYATAVANNDTVVKTDTKGAISKYLAEDRTGGLTEHSAPSGSPWLVGQE